MTNRKPLLRAVLVWGAAWMLFGSLESRAEPFVFEASSPKFRITIPGVPPMKMDAHPMQASKPHLRFLGSNGPYTVSVITPAAAAGMTARECASSIVRTLGARPGVPEPSQIYKARINDNTFIAIYAWPLGGLVQLNAHVLSAVGGTHCIEVHATKMSTSEEDFALWFEGLTNANIESN